MLKHQHCFSVKRMAVVLRVSRSGYYDWRKNGSKLSGRALKQQSRDMKIKELLERENKRLQEMSELEKYKENKQISLLRSIKKNFFEFHCKIGLPT